MSNVFYGLAIALINAWLPLLADNHPRFDNRSSSLVDHHSMHIHVPQTQPRPPLLPSSAPTRFTLALTWWLLLGDGGLQGASRAGSRPTHSDQAECALGNQLLWVCRCVCVCVCVCVLCVWRGKEREMSCRHRTLTHSHTHTLTHSHTHPSLPACVALLLESSWVLWWLPHACAHHSRQVKKRAQSACMSFNGCCCCI